MKCPGWSSILTRNYWIIFEFAQVVKRELPSLMRTYTLPPSPLEIRSSSSRYVVSNHDSALLFDKENFNGGWLEMVFATDEAVSWTELIKPLKGVRSIFCPRNSTFSGTTMESVNWGVPMIPSWNLIWIEGGKIVRDNLELNPKLQNSLMFDRTTWPKRISGCRKYLEYNFVLHPLMHGP